MILFSANDGTNGFELWKTDGTNAGTVMVKDIFSGGSGNPTGFTIYNSEVYFFVDNDTNGYELWKTDGTEAGTVMIVDYNLGTGDAISVSDG